MSAEMDTRNDQGEGNERIGLSSQGPASINGERAPETSSSIEGAGARSLPVSVLTCVTLACLPISVLLSVVIALAVAMASCDTDSRNPDLDLGWVTNCAGPELSRYGHPGSGPERPVFKVNSQLVLVKKLICIGRSGLQTSHMRWRLTEQSGAYFPSGTSRPKRKLVITSLSKDILHD
jgi:hypothetical protein